MTVEQIKEANEITLRDGRRVWIFGCTVLCLMLLAHMASLILVAISTVPRVSKRSLKAYSVCMDKAKDAKVQLKCVYPTPNSSKSVSAKILDAGAYPWAAVIVVFVSCMIFYLMQSREDWQRTREVLQIGASAYSKNAKSPDWMDPKIINQVGQKIVDGIKGLQAKEPETKPVEAGKPPNPLPESPKS